MLSHQAPKLSAFVMTPGTATLFGGERRYFTWKWGDLSRVMISNEVGDEETFRALTTQLQTLHQNGVTPLFVNTNNRQPPVFKKIQSVLGEVGFYSLDDTAVLSTLLMQPDRDAERLWKEICEHADDYPSAEGPSDDAFWKEYGEAFGRWLRALPRESQKEYVPKRPLLPHELRPFGKEPNRYAHRAFPAAWFEVDEGYYIKPHGALLQPVRIVGGVEELSF